MRCELFPDSECASMSCNCTIEVHCKVSLLGLPILHFSERCGQQLCWRSAQQQSYCEDESTSNAAHYCGCALNAVGDAFKIQLHSFPSCLCASALMVATPKEAMLSAIFVWLCV